MHLMYCFTFITCCIWNFICINSRNFPIMFTVFTYWAGVIISTVLLFSYQRGLLLELRQRWQNLWCHQEWLYSLVLWWLQSSPSTSFISSWWSVIPVLSSFFFSSLYRKWTWLTLSCYHMQYLHQKEITFLTL